MNKESKIYVAGHKGLVGSAIWRNLETKGYNRLIGKTSAELDLRNQLAVETFFASEKPEYVFLAAAKVGGILANSTYRGAFIYENLMIQNNVIHQAYLHGVKKLLFLGSTCIYPKEAPQPMKEEYLLTGPLEPTNEPYALAKIAGIKMCESYNQQYKTNFISVMPTNLYGPNDNFNLETSHVLPAMLRKIHLGKLLENGDWEAIKRDLKTSGPIAEELQSLGITLQPDENSNPQVAVEIWGTGTPLREFMWSEDMADACVYLMEHGDAQPPMDQPIQNFPFLGASFVNIGTGKEITISDLAYLIKKITGFQGQIIFNHSKPDGTMRKVTDVTRLHELGWHHTVELEDGINRLYKWYLRQNE